jgi:hypothetical protein
MFDGRETLMPLNNAKTMQNNMNFDLTDQATTAVLTHAQGVAPTAAQLSEIVQFELGLSTAQIHDNEAGSLYVHGASGGPQALSAQDYYPVRTMRWEGDPREGFDQRLFALFGMGEKRSA